MAGAAPITLDSASSGQGTGSSFAWSHTVGAGSGSILVVGVGIENNPDVPVSGVTYGGQVLTLVPGSRASYFDTKANATELWYLLSPAAGTATVTVAFGTSVAGAAGGAVSLFGADQSAPEAVAQYAGLGSGAYSLAITTRTDSAWLVDVVNNGEKTSTVFVAGSSQAGRWDLLGGNQLRLAGSTREVTPAGVATNTWQCVGSGANRQAQSIAAFAPLKPPSVAITSPQTNATVSQAGVNIAASASGGAGVTNVAFYEDGNLLGNDGTAPYTWTWVSAPLGDHVLTARAFDAVGASGTSTPVNVHVTNNMAPVVGITSPADGMQVGRNFTISVTATDDVAVTNVFFYDGGAPLGSDSSSPYSYSWSGAPLGAHTLSAVAWDDTGMAATSVVTVTVVLQRALNVVPRTAQAPAMNGTLAAGEWDDAAAMTGIISQFGQVAHPRQAVFWVKYDTTNIYFACRSTLYTEEVNQVSTPLWSPWTGKDSSIAFGIAPGRVWGGTTASHFIGRARPSQYWLCPAQEIFWSLEGGGGYPDVQLRHPHPGWDVGNWTTPPTTSHWSVVAGGVWTWEAKIPLSKLNISSVTPGEEWGLLLARDYSMGDQAALTLSSDWGFGTDACNRNFGLGFLNRYRTETEYGKITMGSSNSPAAQLLDLGDFAGGHPAPVIAVKNTSDGALQVVARCVYGDAIPPQECTLNLAPGERKTNAFTAVDLPMGAISICSISITGQTGVLLAQDIPMRPGWGQDRATSLQEVYFSGDHGAPGTEGVMPTCYDPVSNRLYACLRPSQLPGVATAEVAVTRSGETTAVAVVQAPGTPVQTDWIADAELPALAPGVYEALARVYNTQGVVIARSRQVFMRYDHTNDLPWLSRKVGISTNVLPPWTPMQAIPDPLTVACWGRTNQVNGGGLSAGITVLGQEMLAAPIQIEIGTGSQQVAFTPAAQPANVTIAASEVSWEGTLTAAGWSITNCARMEYDGYVSHRIRIVPPTATSVVDRIRLLVPLKPEYATHLHAVGGENFRSSVSSIKLGSGTGSLWNSKQNCGGGDYVYESDYGAILMTAGNFRPYVWVGSIERGMAFMADNDRGWVPDDSRTIPAIEVQRGALTNQATAVCLILNLVARPFVFGQPREIEFSLQATPVRPQPDDNRARLNRLSMGSAFPGQLVYGQAGWTEDGQRYTKWNDLIGDHGSTPSPPNWEVSKAFEQRSLQSGGAWVHTPYQSMGLIMTFASVEESRAPPGRKASDVYGYLSPHISIGVMEGGNGAGSITDPDADYRLWCHSNWIHHAGLRGMYWDLTQPHLVANPRAGFGYVLNLPDRPALNGKVQPGFGVTRVRDFYRRLRTLYVENGVTNPYIWIHSTDGNMASAFAFADILMDGEIPPDVTAANPISDKIAPHRQQAMRSSASGLGFVQMGMFPADASTAVKRDVAGWLMLHDTGHPAGSGITLNWAGFDLERREEFLPYWLPQVAAALQATPSEVYASAWRQDNSLRVVVYNRNDTTVVAGVQLDLAALGITNGLPMTVTVPVLQRNFRMFKVQAWDSETPFAAIELDPDGAGAGALECVCKGPPAARFSASHAYGEVPLTVWFTDTSPGAVTNRSWNFGDGASATSAGTTVSHTYMTAGCYRVSLTVSGPVGSDTLDSNACVTAVADGSWFDGWARQMVIAFSGYDRPGALADFPLLLTLGPHLPGFRYDEFASAQGWDLRFSGINGRDELPYEIETWDTNSVSKVWVRVPVLAGPASILAHWGNPAQITQQAYTTNGAVWANGFAGVWHMRQTNAQDSTANHINGISSGNTLVSGMIATGGSFNGSAGINLGNPSVLPAGISARTMSLWSRALSTAPGWRWCAAYGTAGVGQAMFLGQNGTTLYGGGYGDDIGVGDYWDTDHWRHTAVTYAGADARLYGDGHLLARGSKEWNLARNGAYIGKQVNNSEPWNGYLDEVRISSVARSADWIWAECMNVASNSLFPGLGAVQSNGAPAITVQPVNRTNNPGTAATFSIVAVGTAPLAYQWQKNEVNIPGATASSYVIPAVSWADQGGYRCVVTNRSGTVISAVATLARALGLGGNIINDIGGYRIHTFTSDGAFSVNDDGSVDVLVVGGGGGGGGRHSGGGGGGGVVYTTAYPVVAGSNYTVIVGSGGAGYPIGLANAGSPGSNSVFGTLVAFGGGYGHGGGAGGPGGSGGGGGAGGFAGGAATNSQGYRGGSGAGNYAGGGGGGAGGQGVDGSGAGANGKDGGPGVTNSISGTPAVYAGGGGAGSWDGARGMGGSGIGGNGGTGGNPVATDGQPGTGSGGGGGGGQDGGQGGNGGSGVVIVRYLAVPPGLPAVAGLAATGITSTNACMNGTLITNGTFPAIVRLYWGTNDGQNVFDNWQHMNQFPGSFSAGSALATNIAGLFPATRHYYRFYATNGAGETWGATTNFMTWIQGQLAGGGFLTNYYSGITSFVAHVFTNSGSFNVSVSGSVDVLVVGGGGGGGGRHSGGGGAGGLIYTTAYPVVAGSNYTVIVGSGGAGYPIGLANAGSPGSNSVFGALIAFGGGYGYGGGAGGPGGSGGGGAPGGLAGGAATNSQGYRGGSGAGNYAGGGGGGAGGQGVDGGGVGADGKNGGPGVASSISGTPTVYAGGGGGGSWDGARGMGGSGIGGNGGAGGNPAATDGRPGTGSGGGGGGGQEGGQGGNGGSGIVIVRYAYIPQFTSRGTPISWLQSYGYAEPYETADLSDGDEDGATAWEEFQAGTVPTNRASVFKAVGVSFADGSNRVMWYGTTNSGVYTFFKVYRTTNITEGKWTLEGSNLSRSADGTNYWWDSELPGAWPVYYKPALTPTNQ